MNRKLEDFDIKKNYDIKRNTNPFFKKGFRNTRQTSMNHLDGGENMAQISTEELEDTEEVERRVISKDEFPLDIENWEGAEKRESDYPNQDYYLSYSFELQDGEKVIYNSGSSRLENLYEMLASKFDGVPQIPAGKLEAKGEGLEKQFVYKFDE